MNDFGAWQKIIEEWKQADRMKNLNQRLYDELGGAIMYILEYSKRNNIILPNRERLFNLVENIHSTVKEVREFHNRINSLSDENLQSDEKDENRRRLDRTKLRYAYL
jgi:hypothetical protein